MATDPFLLDRIRTNLQQLNVYWTEKRMFGGDCFMVDEKMCFGTYQGGLMARVDPSEAEELSQREGAAQMIHGGRTMTGYLMIQAEGYDAEVDLEFWIQKCLEFNPKAKASKKRQSKL